MNISPTKEAQSVMASLRPPSSRTLRLAYGYSFEGVVNDGFTFELQSGEQVISPGIGTVRSVTKGYAKFQHSDGPLYGTPSYEIVIVHGQGINSVVAGLQSVSVRAGDAVQRGDVLGSTFAREVFVKVTYNGRVFSPHLLNRHWWLQGEYVPGQAGKMRFSPDKLIRDFAGTIASVVHGGIRYFVDRTTGFHPLLVNVDFNGTSMVGFAALGFTDQDYWNNFAAGAFNWVNNVNPCSYYSYSCGTTKVFNVSPQTFLKDSTGTDSSVWLERIAAASAAAGTSAGFTSMGQRYIGGWSGVVPEENFFAVRGLAAGTYRVCLYAYTQYRTPNTGSTFGVAVDNNAPVFKTTTPTTQTAWVEDVDYVRYDVVVPAGSVITIKSYGYLDGLQIERLA